VAQLSQFHTQQLKTFSVNYDFGPQYDESGYAREVATNFGTEHHEIQVTPTLFRDWITSYVWHMDEPVTEAAAISLHYVSALAKQHVTVVLSGEGADELLGGYDIYKYMWAIDRYRRVPKVLRKLVESPLGLLGNAKLNKYVALAQKPIESAYFGVSLYEPSKVAELVSDELRALHTSGHGATVVHNDQIDHPLNKMLDFDVRTWLVDNLLVKADKMTMASSLELRVPFLDYRLIEFCANLPVHYKINRGNKKFLLKHCMREHLPPSITQRKKVGFPTPLAMMFRTELHEYAADLLHSTAFKQRGLFSADTAQRWLTEHRDGQADHHRELWQLVALEEWFRVFVDRQLPTTA
ncbi:MAG: asparagine synthase C-terminal domain-containing protein, partial [Pseudomonadota bacterium]